MKLYSIFMFVISITMTVATLQLSSQVSAIMLVCITVINLLGYAAAIIGLLTHRQAQQRPQISKAAVFYYGDEKVLEIDGEFVHL